MLKINPQSINIFTKRYLIKLWFLLLTFLALGSFSAFYYSPVDYQQGEYVRLMYLHVPAAWLSIGIYCFIAILSFTYLVTNNPIYDFIAKSSASSGCLFCFITLFTGSFWGKPIWGTWWVWDARLTSMLILFLFYCSYIILASISEQNNSKSAAAIAILGLINIPIVKFSVDLWQNLHQPASIIRIGGPSIHISMLIPLFLMFVMFGLYFLINLLLTMQNHLALLKIKRNSLKISGLRKA